LICNIRGVGYSLPLSLKDPEVSPLPCGDRIRNQKIQKTVQGIREGITESLHLSRRCRIGKRDEGYFLKRHPVHEEVEHLLQHFEKQVKILFQELKRHQADFIILRLECILAKLKTYLGLARLSEFSITKEQWLEWHAHETE